MPTLKERLTDWLPRKRASVSFGIMDERGDMLFVEAHKFTLDRNGRLLFWKRGWLFQRVIAVVEAGKWQQVREGLRLEDFKKE